MSTGRKAAFGVPASEAIRVRVTPEQRRALEEVAQENRTDLSGVIRDAVNTYVSDYKDDRPFPARGTKLSQAS